VVNQLQILGEDEEDVLFGGLGEELSSLVNEQMWWQWKKLEPNSGKGSKFR
jgi:hypothetical protein